VMAGVQITAILVFSIVAAVSKRTEAPCAPFHDLGDTGSERFSTVLRNKSGRQRWVSDTRSRRC
jgi:hypothetical protein